MTVTLPNLLTTDVGELTAAVCDIESVSGNEANLADAIETALATYSHLEVTRNGNAVVARTHLGRDTRVVIAGHIDTVPVADNLPIRRSHDDGIDTLWGRGTVDMKGGVAIALHLAASLTDPEADITWVFYDLEEVDFDRNGLGRLARDNPELLAGDFAILGEPTNGAIEGGCNGNLRVHVTTTGTTAHSARAWRGVNAIHRAAPILARLDNYAADTVVVDGLAYRESLGAVSVTGGIATNMVPDQATVAVNYRFAPSKTVREAEQHVRDLFAGIDATITVVDAAAGARPGLDHPTVANAIEHLTATSGASVGPKYGWTDVARFAAMGIPALNFGPGDPMLAHADDERCPVSQIHQVAAALRQWLTASNTERGATHHD